MGHRVRGPIKKDACEVGWLRGIDDKPGILLGNQPCSLRIRRTDEKARTPCGKHPVNFAGNNKAAEVRPHGDEVGIPRREAFREFGRRLGRQEPDVCETLCGGGALHLRASRSVADQEKHNVPIFENFGGLEHGVKIVGQAHIPRINNHKVSFEVVFAAEGIVFMVDRRHRRRPVRNIENACIGNATLDETSSHAATDGDHSIAAHQRLTGNPAQQGHKRFSFRQDTKFLGNLGIEILRPMNDLVALEKTNHRPQDGKHRGVCHGHNEVCAWKKQSAG